MSAREQLPRQATGRLDAVAERRAARAGAAPPDDVRAPQAAASVLPAGRCPARRPTRRDGRGRSEDAGLRPSPVNDRFWFESIYFKEPGGTLFELATEGPGFGRDEDMAHLREPLILPPWLEAHRGAIEGALPPLELPEGPDGPEGS